jgi:intracellular sulfur oxidation DsrE/DsrF family protein
MDDAKLQGNRRDFLGMAATAAAAGLGAMVPITGAVAAADAPGTDFTRWLDTIPGTHKQLYDMPEVNGGMGLVWSWAFFMTGAPAYGVPESDLAVVMVLRHNALPLAFNDSAWAKYKLGEVFKIEDPDTKAPAVRNPFYLKPGGIPVPDAALQKLIARGVKVAACNLAITFYSGMVAQKMGLKHDDVKKEWTEAVFPGIQVVPSGVVACNGAVSRGCVYVFAG